MKTHNAKKLAGLAPLIATGITTQAQYTFTTLYPPQPCRESKAIEHEMNYHENLKE